MTTSIDDLKAANPYRNQEYNKSGWQKFLSALGFRTEADAWKENMSVQAAEYDAALAQKDFDTQYESAQEQVSRLKMAGLNPDLDPSMVDAGQAGAMGDDPSVPMQSTGEEGVIINAAKSIVNAVTMAFGIASNIGELRHIGIMNAAGSIDNSEKVFKFADWVYHNTRSASEVDNSDTDNMSLRFTRNRQLAQSLGLSKRFRRQFEQNIASLDQNLGAQAEYWSKLKSANSDKLEVARQMDSRYFGDGSLPSMRIVNEGLVELSDLATKLSLQSSANKDQYDAAYFENLDPSVAAGAENIKKSNEAAFQHGLDPAASAAAENAEAGFRSQTANVQREINSVMSSIVHKLKSHADKGDALAQSLLFSFAIARMSSVNLGPKGLSFGLNP